MDEKDNMISWLASRKTGASAMAIFNHLTGRKSDGSYPHDGGDFDRCEGLFSFVPSFRERLGEMAGLNKYWAALVPEWDAIKASPDRYKAIASIVRPIEKNDGSVVRIGENVTIRFGDIKCPNK